MLDPFYDRLDLGDQVGHGKGFGQKLGLQFRAKLVGDLLEGHRGGQSNLDVRSNLPQVQGQLDPIHVGHRHIARQDVYTSIRPAFCDFQSDKTIWRSQHFVPFAAQDG